MKAIVVDREWEIRESLKRKLQGRGFEVFTAATAEEALNLCIVVDVNWVFTASDLPEMSGFALIQRIKEGRKDLNVSGIVLVSRNKDLAESLGPNSGVAAILKKPVTEEALAKTLDKEFLYSESNP